MVGVQRVCCEVRQQIEHLVREAADVEDVLSLGSLRRSGRLDVDADQFRVRVASAELGPLRHRRRPSIATSINPRLVVRDVDHHIAGRFSRVQ